MNKFIFKNYSFDKPTGVATFNYCFDDDLEFSERVVFNKRNDIYDEDTLDRALFLSFILLGTSYYKAFPVKMVQLSSQISHFQAEFFNAVYQEGLSQFAYENSLTRNDLAVFQSSSEKQDDNADNNYQGEGILSLQSGGKDSLLVSVLLEESRHEFTPWFLSSGDHHPDVLNDFNEPLVVANRTIDKDALEVAKTRGAKNGHVPITYMVQSLALIQAILLGKNQVIVSIGNEGAEPNAVIGDLEVNHQWSKTWEAERLFSEYVSKCISKNIFVGSPIRAFSELRVTELFVKKCWNRYGHKFSSCNVANYRQRVDNSNLRWCGDCPKCANSFLLFSAFVEANELKSLFSGQDLYSKPSLEYSFKGLLGIDGVMKPLECVGEVDELRLAYNKSQQSGGYAHLNFDVPGSDFDFRAEYDHQSWAYNLVKNALGDS